MFESFQRADAVVLVVAVGIRGCGELPKGWESFCEDEDRGTDK